MRQSIDRLGTIIRVMMALLVMCVPATAQTLMKIRPQSRSNDVLTNPANAYDTNPGTFSAKSATRSCNGGGTGTDTFSTEYYNIPAAAEPDKLLVKWSAGAGGTLWTGDLFTTTVTIEYSLDDGGAWDTLTEYIFQLPAPPEGNPDPPGVTETWMSLDEEQDAEDVRVRVRLKLDQICHPGFNVGNISGSLKIYDVRIEAPLPPLDVSPNPVTRGSTLSLSFGGPPDTTFSWWKYVTPSNGTVTRTVDVNTASWVGTVVDSGTVQVRVTIGGDIFDLEGPVTVSPRSDWAWAAVSPSKEANPFQTPIGNYDLDPVDPPDGTTPVGGESALEFYVSRNPLAIDDDGPNHAFKYYTYWNDSGGGSATAFYYVIADDVEDTMSEFYLKQCGDYDPMTQTGVYISGENLAANTVRHEAGASASHYREYVDAQDNPANNLGVHGEAFVRGPAVSQSEFDTAAMIAATAKVGVISSATQQHGWPTSGPPPVNYSAAGQYLGNVNYAPNYNTCP